MDFGILNLAIFVAATFLATFVTGLSGFAFGLVAAGVWLHVITPVQTATLIIAFGLLAQGSSVWKLRHALNWSRLWPFLLGGAFGVPLGVGILEWVNPRHLREGVGAVLILYSLYSLVRPNLKPLATNSFADAAIGFLNGILGGATGLAGIVVAVWCGIMAWPKDQQRAVFQPVILTGMMMIGLSLSVAGAVGVDTLKLYALGLPALLIGLWLGFKCYGKLDDATFRKLVLVLLLCSGIGLIAAQRSMLARVSSGIASALVSPAVAAPVCKPVLSIVQTELSEVQPAKMERRWTAMISADASKCATKAGYFEMGFLREKENSLPLEFREQFIWVGPSSLVGVDVWADEAIERAWVDSVQPCTCADPAPRE